MAARRLPWLALSLLLPGADGPAPERRFVGVTLPSENLEIGAAQEGILAVVAVVDGQAVKCGDLLFRLTTEIEELEVERLRVLAESDAAVREAKAKLLQAENEERRYLDLQGRDMAGDSEVDMRRREAEVARIGLERALLAHRVDVSRYEEAKVRLAQRVVTSPIDGRVAARLRLRGEPVEKLQPVVRLVKLDPLWVEFDCPVEDGKALAKGTAVRVVQAADKSATADARVVFTSPTADAASQTFRVRLELANPSGWQAGLKVEVEVAAER